MSLLNISAAGTINSECLCLVIDLLKHVYYAQGTKFLIKEKNLLVCTYFYFSLHNYLIKVEKVYLAFFIAFYMII